MRITQNIIWRAGTAGLATTACLLTIMPWTVAATVGMSITTLALARWVRSYRLRGVCETAAIIAPGLVLLAAWDFGAQIAEIKLALNIAALISSATVELATITSVPTWTITHECQKTIATDHATLRALPEIIKLVQQCFSHMPISILLLGWLILRRGCYVAQEEGQIIGVMATFPLAREAMWIELLAVHPAYRRRGIGARLLEGLGETYLTVRAENAGAIAFYQRMGFEPVETWQDYYGRDAAALVMRKTRCSPS